MKSEPTRYQLCRDEVAWSSLGNEAVLVQLSLDEVHLANATAAVLVDALLEGASLEDLTRRLTETFEVDGVQARQDVERFVQSLLAARMAAPAEP